MNTNHIFHAGKTIQHVATVLFMVNGFFTIVMTVIAIVTGDPDRITQATMLVVLTFGIPVLADVLVEEWRWVHAEKFAHEVAAITGMILSPLDAYELFLDDVDVDYTGVLDGVPCLYEGERAEARFVLIDGCIYAADPHGTVTAPTVPNLNVRMDDFLIPEVNAT